MKPIFDVESDMHASLSPQNMLIARPDDPSSRLPSLSYTLTAKGIFVKQFPWNLCNLGLKSV